MSRIIKFRAWDKLKKEWSNLICGMNLYPSIITEIQPIEANKNLELMQYTGFKDKNGKEIYEGDIIKAIGNILSVKFNETKARFDFLVHDVRENKKYEPEEVERIEDIYCYQVLGKGNYEVIGNIYENPELLK